MWVRDAGVNDFVHVRGCALGRPRMPAQHLRTINRGVSLHLSTMHAYASMHAYSCAYAWTLTYTFMHVHACVHVRMHTHKCRLTPRTCCTLANDGLMQKGFGLEKQPNFTQVCARERDLSTFTSLSLVFSLRCLCPHPALTNSTGGAGRSSCSSPSK